MTRALDEFIFTRFLLGVPAGQYSVVHMLSESHNTDKIHFFFMTLNRFGAPVPKEIVMDMSRALLNAVTRAYTHCDFIEEYAEKCWEGNKLPKVYIRLDNAHFLKLYSTIINKEKKMTRTKRLYLASVGPTNTLQK